MSWFAVDKQGLAKVLARRGKGFALLELVQNAWDQDVKFVDVTLKRVSGRKAHLKVTDDDPNGFSDLDHAFTLFAESEKKSDVKKRGRFNLGEKLVLSLCDQARITTTSGSVIFDTKGRRRGRKKTERGSVFEATLSMNNAEMIAAIDLLDTVIVPDGIQTTINGRVLQAREPIGEFSMALPTEVANEEGYLHRRVRTTLVRVYEPITQGQGTLFEMGIPVVTTGDSYDADIAQKLPIAMERDNVNAAYLRAVRAGVLNCMHERLTQEESAQGWVRVALGDKRCSDDAIKSAVTARFGKKAVVYDPSDLEANAAAVAQGYVVVHGGQMDKNEWQNVKRAEALRPAGQVMPTPKPFSNDPDAKKLRMLDPEKWSNDERARVDNIRRLGKALIDREVVVRIANDVSWPFAAAYGDGELTINRGRLGAAWFIGQIGEEELELIVHEFGHEYEGNHLSAKYHDALCKIGAKLAIVAARDPSIIGVCPAASYTDTKGASK